MVTLLNMQAIIRKRAILPWDLSSNTVVQYKLNDDLATTAVIDTEGTNGTATDNTEDLSATGKINNALFFTAANVSEYVNCNQTFQTTFRSAFNISVWAKPDDGQPVAARVLFGSEDAWNENSIQIDLLTDGKVRLLYISGNTSAIYQTNDVIFPDGATSWTHLLFNVNPTAITCYVNAVQKDYYTGYSGDMSVLTMGDWTCTVNCLLGAEGVGASAVGYYGGGIDDFRIHDRILTTNEIKGVYNNGYGTELQLVA